MRVSAEQTALRETPAPNPTTTPASSLSHGTLGIAGGPIGQLLRERPLTALFVLLAAAAIFLLVHGRIDRRSRAALPIERHQEFLDFD